MTGTKPQGHATPEIVVTGRHLRDIADDAVSALKAANVPPVLFRRQVRWYASLMTKGRRQSRSTP